jgi:hypothetical protein
LQKKRICSARSASVSPGLQVHSTCNMGSAEQLQKSPKQHIAAGRVQRTLQKPFKSPLNVNLSKNPTKGSKYSTL